MALTQNSIEHVVEDGLCHRCGACLPICPVPQCITVDETMYPQVDSSTCIECGLCEQVCSGDKLDMTHLKSSLPGAAADAETDSPLGGFHQPWICHARNERIRKAGASGGVVSQLLIQLLERGEIDGAIVAAVDRGTPWQFAPQLARTPEDILAAAGSKYTATPMVRAMQHVLRSGRRGGDDRLAFVGVACHVHSLRMMMDRLKQVRRRIRYVIGPLCKSAFDPEATTDLLRANGISRDALERFEFRGGEWPGVMQARLKDGRQLRLHQSNFRDGAYNYMMSLYTQPRCHLCYDFGNELADITVGDPWSLDRSGNYTHTGGHTLAIPRTDAGLQLIRLMQDDPAFSLEPAPKEAIQFHQRAARSKQSLVEVRISAMSRRKNPTPQYDRELPRASASRRIISRLFLLTLYFGYVPGLRYWVLRLLISRPAIVLVYLRQLRKFGLRGLIQMNRLTPREERHHIAETEPTSG